MSDAAGKKRKPKTAKAASKARKRVRKTVPDSSGDEGEGNDADEEECEESGDEMDKYEKMRDGLTDLRRVSRYVHTSGRNVCCCSLERASQSGTRRKQ